MRKEKIIIAYSDIGFGRSFYAFNARKWAEHCHYPAEAIDVLSLESANRARVVMMKSGYNILSHLPNAAYRYARDLVDRNGNGSLVNTEEVKQKFEGGTVLSVSPLATTVLANAGISHFAVLGDAYLAKGFCRPEVKRLYSPVYFKGDKIKVVNGTMLPQGYRHLNEERYKEEHRYRLGVNGEPRIGFATHGAGDIQTLCSFFGILPALRQRRVHAAFFTGTHKWMDVMLRAFANEINIPVEADVNKAGSVSLWSGKTVKDAVQTRAAVMSSIDFWVSATANEMTYAGPVMIRKCRNDNEIENKHLGEKGGWLRKTRLSGAQVWSELNPLFNSPFGNQSFAQLMFQAWRSNVNVAAGGEIIRDMVRA